MSNVINSTNVSESYIETKRYAVCPLVSGSVRRTEGIRGTKGALE
jgi:hypothetical protein